jgi:hypothetical protein
MARHFNVQVALDKLVHDVPNLPTLVPENVGYKPNPEQSFIRTTNLPAAANLSTMDNTQQYNGVYQIDIFIKTNEGKRNLLLLLDEIHDQYKNNRNLQEGNTKIFIREIGILPASREDAFFRGSVVITYNAFDD